MIETEANSLLICFGRINSDFFKSHRNYLYVDDISLVSRKDAKPFGLNGG